MLIAAAALDTAVTVFILKTNISTIYILYLYDFQRNVAFRALEIINGPCLCFTKAFSGCIDTTDQKPEISHQLHTYFALSAGLLIHGRKRKQSASQHIVSSAVSHKVALLIDNAH